MLQLPDAAERPGDRIPVVSPSLLPPRVDTELRSLERSSKVDRDPTTALRETVEAIWRIVEQAGPERALDGSRHGVRALLARRELLQRGTYTLSGVIRRGIGSGEFQPRCASWAIRRLPFAIVAGACVHWVVGLATAPSLRASTAVRGALEVLRPRASGFETARSHRNGLTAPHATAVNPKASRVSMDVGG